MKQSDIFNLVNPIVGIEIYSGGVIKVKRESKIKGRFNYDKGRKDRPIVKFSPRSMARLVATANATKIEFKSMITLTYPNLYPKDGRIVKAAMNNLLTTFRDRHWGSYLWFLEFQARGAPHFHILSEINAITPRMRVCLAEVWVGRWSKENWFYDEAEFRAVGKDECRWEMMARTLSKAYYFILRRETWELLRSKDAGRRYTTKYATKEYQKEVPDGFEGIGRFWGCSKNVMLGEGIYREMDETRLRVYLEGSGHATAEWEVLPKFLFNVRQEIPIKAGKECPI